jgi:hypothetical protein
MMNRYIKATPKEEADSAEILLLLEAPIIDCYIMVLLEHCRRGGPVMQMFVNCVVGPLAEGEGGVTVAVADTFFGPAAVTLAGPSRGPDRIFVLRGRVRVEIHRALDQLRVVLRHGLQMQVRFLEN